MLLLAKANPNHRNKKEETPLMMASRSGCQITVTNLIKFGAKINCFSLNKESALTMVRLVYLMSLFLSKYVFTMLTLENISLIIFIKSNFDIIL